MGDFNIDLLQYDTNTTSNDFINSMTAHSFLPCILQPTRVMTISGNLTSLISDHFIQFMFVKKHHPSYKFCNYCVNHYSNFGKKKFIHDFSLIDWSPLTDSPELVNINFNYFYS